VLPLLPLRDVVVFPHMVIPLFVGRPKSIKALEAAMEEGKNVVLVAQKSAAKDEPAPEDLYEVGTVSTILQMLKLPDGTVKVLVEGVQRARIERVLTDKANFEAEIELIVSEEPDSDRDRGDAPHAPRAVRPVREAEQEDPAEVLTSLSGIDGAGRLSDTIAAHLPLKLEQKQQILEMSLVARRLEQLLQLLETEIDIMQVEKRIRGRVKRQMEKSQREYYLNEQVKAIQKELGDSKKARTSTSSRRRSRRRTCPRKRASRPKRS
jgi:ATP-dependent Lon protease